jgi:hypothetical protein
MTPPFFGHPETRTGALFFAWILAWLPAAPALAATAAAGAELVTASSFAADAATARARRIPILVFYTRPNCSWCEQVRREHLRPLVRDPASAGRVLVREVKLDEAGAVALTDFDGGATTHSAFGRGRGIRLSPTLDFLDDRGQRLVEPIIGVRLPDFYGAFIDRAIDDSLTKLRSETK